MDGLLGKFGIGTLVCIWVFVVDKSMFLCGTLIGYQFLFCFAQLQKTRLPNHSLRISGSILGYDTSFDNY